MSRICLAALAALALAAAPAAAQTRSITTYGTAQAEADLPRNGTADQVQQAFEAAEAEALPKALDAARKRADVLAKAAGAQVGDVITIEEIAADPFPMALEARGTPPVLLGQPGPFALRACPVPPPRRGRRPRPVRCDPGAAATARLKVTYALR